MRETRPVVHADPVDVLRQGRPFVWCGFDLLQALEFAELIVPALEGAGLRPVVHVVGMPWSVVVEAHESGAFCTWCAGIRHPEGLTWDGDSSPRPKNGERPGCTRTPRRPNPDGTGGRP